MISLLLSLLCLRVAMTQDDFSDQIKCYVCEGTAVNSTCSDPVDVGHETVTTKVCDRGICLKWTKYRAGVLQIIRTCSSDLDFHLTMIDGVCRTERNGNGYLCMCGKHLCNSAASPHSASGLLQRRLAMLGHHLTLWGLFCVLLCHLLTCTHTLVT